MPSERKPSDFSPDSVPTFKDGERVPGPTHEQYQDVLQKNPGLAKHLRETLPDSRLPSSAVRDKERDRNRSSGSS